mgnify:CR=1 FL=1
MGARETALRVLMSCRNNHAWADAALKAQLGRDGLVGPEAALCSRLVYGVVQNQQLLDFYLSAYCSQKPDHLQPPLLEILRLGAYQILYLDRVPDSAAVNTSVELAKISGRGQASGLVNAVLRKIAQNKTALPPIPERDEAKYLSIRYSHPKWLVKRLLSILGREETEAFLAANNDTPPLTVQVNPLKTNAESLIKELEGWGVKATPHPWVPGCLELTGAGDLTTLAPFREVSRQKIRKIVEAEMASIGADPGAEKITELVETRLREEIRRGVQTIQYQVVTLLTTNGQAPFITVFMYLGEAETEREKKDLAMIIEEMLLQRYQGVKNEDGVWVTPAFPKLIYVLEEDNITEDAPYWYLTELAAKCTARRMVPDYISEKKMRELKGDVYTCMGCRSFLTPDRFTDAGIGNIANAKNYQPGKHKYYGRFNQGVVTINLPDVALSSGGNLDKFWKIFEDRLELCHRALQCRHERLKGTTSDAAPILWQYGALARLKKGETIDKLLYNGYSTISLGYAGLYECVKYMTGKSHTDPSATPFALSIMQKMNDKCAEWKKAENIDYSLYGTPLESTTYKFAKCLQRRFGIIEGITDKGYITNSYHVHVTEEINAFDKLKFEAQFQHLSPGGAISYVEVPDMQNNIPAVLEVMKFIYNNIIYAELNTKSDYCQVCGWDGEIQIVEDNGKLIWKCPKCGNTDQDKMNVARRTCGYIGTQFWNQGRTQEIRDRVLHL